MSDTINKKGVKNKMQELIKQHIRGIKGFAEDYGIPYNTVCQWANGTRNPPEWLTKLLYSIREKQDIKQLEISNEIYQVYITEHTGSRLKSMYIGELNDGIFNGTKTFWKEQAKKDQKNDVRYKVLFEEFKVMRIKK